MTFNLESFEVQKVLSRIIENPSKSSQEIIAEVFPEKVGVERNDILSEVKKYIAKQLKVTLDPGLPKLLHRLRFGWTVLRQADNLLRKTKAKDFPTIISSEDLPIIFSGLFPSQEVHDCLFESLCLMLRVEPKGSFIKHYASFRKQNTPKPLEMPLKDNAGNININNFRRLLFWILRKNRFQYVELNEENRININFPYLVKYIKNELPKYFKASSFIEIDEKITEEFEYEINKWLTYSCLQGDYQPSKAEEQKELVSFFLKDNLLSNKIFVDET